MDDFSDWNPEDYQDLYVIPGLVDFNVKSNGDWDSLHKLTKKAISGGVTLIGLEPSSLYEDHWDFSKLYTDIGLILTFNDRSLAPSGPGFALKVYLSA